MKIDNEEQYVMTLIMAAGKGTRMKSEKSKLVHKIYDKELVKRVVEIAQKKGDKALVAEYNKLLLFDRNIGMANKLKEYFNDNKKVFYMVGAAHLVGDKGIAKLLENDGYNVKKVN